MICLTQVPSPKKERRGQTETGVHEPKIHYGITCAGEMFYCADAR